MRQISERHKIQIAGLVVQLDFARLQHAERKEVLDEMLQAVSAGMHVAQHFALAVVQRAQFFSAQQFDIPIQNG